MGLDLRRALVPFCHFPCEELVNPGRQACVYQQCERPGDRVGQDGAPRADPQGRLAVLVACAHLTCMQPGGDHVCAPYLLLECYKSHF